MLYVFLWFVQLHVHVYSFINNVMYYCEDRVVTADDAHFCRAVVNFYQYESGSCMRLVPDPDFSYWLLLRGQIKDLWIVNIILFV